MKNLMHSRVLILGRDVLILLSLAACVPGFAQSGRNPVVIQMKDRQVTLDEFNARFEIAVRMLASRQGIEYGSQDPEKINMLRVQYLQQRATELAMLQEADRLQVQVDDKQIDAAVAEFHHQAGADKSMPDILKMAGLKQETQLRDFLREQERIRLATEKLLQQIIVPPGDVMTMHHDLADELITPEQICVRQIAVTDENTARLLLEKLKQGADFEALAKQQSTDKRTAEKGGDMGCFEREGMLARSDFEESAFNAKTGVVTGPVKSEFGHHLILVYDRKPPHVPTLNEAYADLEDEIRHEKLPDVLAGIRDASMIKTFPDRLGIKVPERTED